MRISDWSSDVCSSDLIGWMKSGLVSSTWRGPTQISPLSKIAVSPTSSTGRMPKPRPAQPAIEAARMAMICAILLMGYSVLGLRFPGVGRDVGLVALIVVSTFASETVDEVTLLALGRAAAAFVKDIAMVDLDRKSVV